MSEETPKLQRDNTMVATAKEGEAFLEGKGQVDGDAKTRGQQKEIEEITSKEESELKRTTTMAETAKEGKEILDGEELGKTRAQTNAEKNSEAVEENGTSNGKHDAAANDGPEPDSKPKESEDDEKAAVKRTHTMDETLKEGEEYLKKQKVDGDTAAEDVKA